MTTRSGLSEVARLVRRHDPDRFFTALLAPAAHRETLFTLYAFNHEIARAGEVASEPTLALIRLQWWREVVAGADRRHEVATPLRAAIAAGALSPDPLFAMIDAREAEADAIATLGDWTAYVRGTAGTLAVAAARALRASAADDPTFAALGSAYGMAGQLRSVAVQAAAGRCLLPSDVLAEAGLSPEAVIGAPTDLAVSPVVRRLVGVGLAVLAEAGRALPRRGRAAALTGVLARRDLARLAAEPRVAQPAPRGAGDKLAILRASLTGRI